MDYLVLCPCSHALDRHGPEGCGGDAKASCGCRRDRDDALAEAVADARSSSVPEDGRSYALWPGREA